MTTTDDPTTATVGEVRMLINGDLVEAASGKRFDNINPATEEVLGPVADADADDMRRAISAARRAFDETSWSTDKALRKRCLEQLHAAFDAEREELRAELVAEVGCPVAITYGPQLDAPLEDGLLWPARTIDEFVWERDLPDGHAFGTTSWRKVIKEAAGVVGAIIPWNYPFEVTLQKVGQALATGNTLIVKPAPDTPWNATRLGRLVAEKTDIPAGVLNVVTSSDHLVGEELVTDPRVDLISFTGSTVVGRRIMEKGAATMKRLFLELGGKSAQIILDDADFEATMPFASFVCMHGGQGCAMLTRMLVPRSRYDEAIDLMTPGFKTVTIGDPTDPSVIQGPQISAKQRERVLGYIEKGVAEGARLVTGGGRPADLPKGWYVEPTLFADVDNSMTIAREEIFGPVVSILTYANEEDAIRLANDSEYGLVGYVQSADRERGLRVAREIRAGYVSVNYPPLNIDVPHGGYRRSGNGRQWAEYGIAEYLEYKALVG